MARSCSKPRIPPTAISQCSRVWISESSVSSAACSVPASTPTWAATARSRNGPGTSMTTIPALKQLTPVLIVEAVEPCLKFWVDRLGFAITNQVPAPDGKLIFASVQLGPVEIMYQTRASVVDEQPGTAKDLMGHSV